MGWRGGQRPLLRCRFREEASGGGGTEHRAGGRGEVGRGQSLGFTALMAFSVTGEETPKGVLCWEMVKAASCAGCPAV